MKFPQNQEMLCTTHTDILLDIIEDFYAPIFEKYGLDHLQIELDINSEQVDDKGDVLNSKIRVKIKNTEINRNNFNIEIGHCQEGSGWVDSGLGILRVMLNNNKN